MKVIIRKEQHTRPGEQSAVQKTVEKWCWVAGKCQCVSPKVAMPARGQPWYASLVRRSISTGRM